MPYPYSDLLMDHFLHPRNVGVLPDANGVGRARNDVCGDTTQIYLRINRDVIQGARFLASGCGPGIACASWLLEQVVGQPIEAATQITRKQIAKALKLPSAKQHAADLAVQALQAALADRQRLQASSKDLAAATSPATT